jgi:hypothetical protein
MNIVCQNALCPKKTFQTKICTFLEKDWEFCNQVLELELAVVGCLCLWIQWQYTIRDGDGCACVGVGCSCYWRMLWLWMCVNCKTANQASGYIAL